MEAVEVFELYPDQILPEQPFTHPKFIAAERATLVLILERVCRLLESRPEMWGWSAIHFTAEEEGRSHRYVIPQPARLLRSRDLHAVGFFGQKRAQAPAEYFGDLGTHLANAVCEQEDILAYNTLGLAGGNFGNLVLMADSSARDRWLAGRQHARAVQISPGYYATLRIYNGVLPGGIARPQSLRMVRVKYFNYLCDPVWRAQRQLEPCA